MRFWEIDVLRGVAIVLMIVFNYAFTFAFLGLLSFESEPFWFLFPRVIAAMFVILAGLSLVLGYEKSGAGKQALRGLSVFGCGLLITGATLILVPQYAIYFGVLHLIGFSILAALPLMRMGKDTIALLAAAGIVFGLFLNTFTVDFPWLLWLGFMPTGFMTLDYFPVFSWFGVFLLGVYMGKKYYAGGKRRFKIRNVNGTGPLAFIGRHTLIIYMLHQPVLLIALHLAGLL
jgi:uncharacterized membrane protein